MTDRSLHRIRGSLAHNSHDLVIRGCLSLQAKMGLLTSWRREANPYRNIGGKGGTANPETAIHTAVGCRLPSTTTADARHRDDG